MNSCVTILRLLTASLLLFASSPTQTALSKTAPEAKTEYLAQAWTTETGLPQNAVTAILQTRDGYLWLGTLGGLVRFDGVKHTVFEVGDPAGIKGNRVMALYEDRQGNLWVGTTDAGVSKYSQGKFTNYTVADGLPKNTVYALCEDRQGNIWLGGNGGLVRFSQGKFTTYTTTDGLPSNDVLAILEDRRGTLWVGTTAGLVRHGAGQFSTYTTKDGLPHNYARVLYEGRDGSLWVGGSGGLARFKDGFVAAYTQARGLSHNQVWSVTEDREGNLWVGTDVSLDRLKYDRPGVTVAAYTRQDGLPQGKINSVTQDREGNLWIGADGGLARFRPKRLVTYGKDQGFPVGQVVPITEGRDGEMWVGLTCGGLARFKDGAFTFYREGLPSGCVWSLLAEPDGGLWVGTWNGGLAQFKGGSFKTYTSANSGLSSNLVLALYRDRENALWVGTSDGLNRFKDGAFTVYRRTDGLVYDDVRFITEDSQGALWVGTTGGMSHFKDGRFTNYTTETGLTHNFVRAIHEDGDGTIWVGTYGGGLSRLKGGKFTHVTSKNGLVDNVVSRILPDGRGNFWLTGNKGIFRVSQKELNDFADGRVGSVTCVSYGTADGMKNNECNGGGQPAGWQARDGKLWFPTQEGVVVIDPDELGQNKLPPPVAIDQVLVDDRRVDALQALEVPPGQGKLEIHYTGLSFVAPERVQFKYRLEGYDPDWVAVGTRRVAYYTNIPPGRYTFRVIVSNNDGVWNETGAVVELDLAPHFYQTGWFYALCAGAVVLSGVGVYRMRVKHLLRRTRVLESKVAERTAELVTQKNKHAQANHQLEEVNRQLGSANFRLEQANDDLLVTLNQLRIGVLMTDAAGAIMFLNEAAQTLIGKSEDEVVGRHWQQLLPPQGRDASSLQHMAELPPVQRSKVPVNIESGEGRRYWMEIEVQDDPQDRQRKIFFLYDVSEAYDLRLLLDQKAQFQGLVGQSVPMQIVYKQIQDIARVETTVLIEGETGTGKELVARAIHYSSPRKNKPFIAVNCAGLTESLLASQLFGHKRGAFTGAVADHLGLFEAAQGGTLFLDEIGDIPASVQTSLLRVLQEKEITRLGESKPRKIDVRIITATHRDLSRRVAEGAFREDLLYRIRVARIAPPPLRERREDIPLIATWSLGQARTATGKQVQGVSSEAMKLLLEYPWPGNVRELRSAIESAVIQCKGPIIQPGDLPTEITSQTSETARVQGDFGGSYALVPVNGKNQDERRRILEALERAKGNRAAAARLLGIGRTTLYRRLKELNIDEQAEAEQQG